MISEGDADAESDAFVRGSDPGDPNGSFAMRLCKQLEMEMLDHPDLVLSDDSKSVNSGPQDTFNRKMSPFSEGRIAFRSARYLSDGVSDENSSYLTVSHSEERSPFFPGEASSSSTSQVFTTEANFVSAGVAPRPTKVAARSYCSEPISEGQVTTTSTLDSPFPISSPQGATISDSASSDEKLRTMLASLRRNSEPDTASSRFGSEPPSPGMSTTGLNSTECQDMEARRKAWNDRKKARQAGKEARQQAQGSMGYGGASPTAMFSSLSPDADITNVLEGKGLPIRVLELLGQGTFAKVYRGVWSAASHGCEAHSMVAVKLINFRQSRPILNEAGDSAPPKWLQREVKTSLAQNHENLLRVIEASVAMVPYALVLEYCAGGALHDLVSAEINTSLKRLSWKQRLKVALDVSDGMAHLHSQRIMHRDLKPQNILLKDRILSVEDVPHAKVCDFGLARYHEEGTKMTCRIGSWQFMAPEVFMEDAERYDEKIDVYSYSMVLYVMLSGQYPFAEMSFTQFTLFVARGGRPDKKATVSDTAPEVLRELMLSAWETEPPKRPTFDDIGTRLRGEISPQCLADKATTQLQDRKVCCLPAQPSVGDRAPRPAHLLTTSAAN